MSGFGSSPLFSKEIGPVTVGQILAMAVAMVLGLLLLTFGGANSPLVILIVAVIIYMLPHLAGADLKVKAGFGVVFAVVAIIFGAFIVGPAFIHDNSSQHLSERNDISFDVECKGPVAHVTVSYAGTDDLVIVVSEIEGVIYRSVSTKIVEQIPVTSSVTDVALDPHKLYSLCVAPVDEHGNPVTSKASFATIVNCGFDGDSTLISTMIIVGYIMLIFFLILGLSTIMRRKISDTRAKMEAAGRLYPQGYGRCTFCGAVVLPGEVNCRKCGAYIDRPDYMKPKKKNYLSCSVCGAEITEDMTECPKCGARFDGEESVVIHADGSSDSTEDTIACPGCGKDIPSVSDRCPYCGKKLE